MYMAKKYFFKEQINRVSSSLPHTEYITHPSYSMLYKNTVDVLDSDSVFLCQSSQLTAPLCLLRAFIYSLQPLKIHIIYLCICLRLVSLTRLQVI